MGQGEPAIVFFDGDCHICNGAVRFIIWAGDPDKIKLSPLQGSTAAQRLDLGSVPDSIILLTDHQVLYESEAVLAIGQLLGQPWPLLATLARTLPKLWLDGIYRFIARNRLRFLGPKTSCRLATAYERRFFLP